MNIEVHESALDAIKAMGQRDKDEIDRLRKSLENVGKLFMSHGLTNCADYCYGLMVNPYSTAIIQKAE